jgi:hypothetical protein
MKPSFHNKLSIAALAALGLTACVAEDYGACLDTRLLIATDHEVLYASRADGRTSRTEIDEWYNCVESVCVYVFDEQHRYVTHRDAPKFTWRQTCEVPLREMGICDGVYTFVVWTNHNDLYSSNVAALNENGGAHLDACRLDADTSPGEMTGDFTHLHHGILEKVRITNNSPVEDVKTIIIDPVVHKVNFAMSGLDGNDHSWSLTVTDRNGLRNFRNEYVEGEDREYTLTRTLDLAGETRATQTGSTSMMLLQLHDDTGTDLTLKNETTGQVHYQTDLVELIERVYGFAAGQAVDFERTLEFDVTLNFAAQTIYSITINGWTYRLNENWL